MSVALKLDPENLKNTEEYKDLEIHERPAGVIYGPGTSRRLGSVLGINLVGTADKVCSFDCPYCDLGRTQIRMNRIKSSVKFPSVEKIEVALRTALLSLKNNNTHLDHLVISGYGESTLHPEFDDAVKVIMAAASESHPHTKIVALTNGAHLDNRRVVAGLNLLHERMIKVDAGNDAVFKQVNSPLVRTSISKIIAGTRRLKDIIAQTIFVDGIISNSQDQHIDEWLEVIGLLKPKAVHIYGMNRVPSTPGLIRVSEERLDTIASLLHRKTGLKAQVFK